MPAAQGSSRRTERPKKEWRVASEGPVLGVPKAKGEKC